MLSHNYEFYLVITSYWPYGLPYSSGPLFGVYADMKSRGAQSRCFCSLKEFNSQFKIEKQNYQRKA